MTWRRRLFFAKNNVHWKVDIEIESTLSTDISCVFSSDFFFLSSVPESLLRPICKYILIIHAYIHTNTTIIKWIKSEMNIHSNRQREERESIKNLLANKVAKGRSVECIISIYLVAFFSSFHRQRRHLYRNESCFHTYEYAGENARRYDVYSTWINGHYVSHFTTQ